MRCNRCGADNPDNLSFCRDCGNRLNAGAVQPQPQRQHPPTQAAPGAYARPQAPIPGAHAAGGGACPACGTPNPSSNRFCLNCGRPMGAGGAAAPQNPAAAAAPQRAAPAPAPYGQQGPPVGYGQQRPPVQQAQPPPAPVPQQAAAAHLSQINCGRCHGVNPPGTRYCQYCGTQLLGSVPPQREPNVPAMAHGQGRAGPPPAAAGAMSSARLVVITQDGSAGRQYPIDASQADMGRDEGSVTLPNDPYVSPRHARIQQKNGRFFLRDLGSLNGIYLRLRGPHPLQHGDLVLIGLEVLRFEFVSDAEKNLGTAVEGGTQVFGSPATTRHARLCQRTVEGVTRDVYTLTRDETTLGRESGDVVFTSDPFMSRQHAMIKRDPSTNAFSLQDLGSSNGTYVAIRSEVELLPGDHVRIGQHLFRLDVDARAQF